MLLESAWFDPISIRRTSKALDLRTEASLRFERGADPEMAEIASRRCAALICRLPEAKFWPESSMSIRRAARRRRSSFRGRSCCA